jgi:inner membrane protein
METKNKIRHYSNNPIAKGALGILIAVLLLIPMGMVESLILERKDHHTDVAREISRDWGRAQVLQGPFLEVPYTRNPTNKEIKEGNVANQRIISKAVFLPEELKIDGSIQPEYKHRGIYKFVVYLSDFNISGTYRKPNQEEIEALLPNLQNKTLLWEKAKLKFYISETKGLTNNVKVKWNKDSLGVLPELKTIKYNNSNSTQSFEGFACDVNFDSAIDNHFSFNVKLKGSQEISFIPLGKFTEIDINSPWSSPKFGGNYLPDQREISDSGFTAHWNISQLNRPIKQAWLSTKIPRLGKYAFGVQLIEPVDKYHKSLRAAKYAILFILLTFVSLFFVEIFAKRESNMLQYILTGLALILFYSILVSLTEQMSFDLAYLISSVAIIGLISTYTYSISKDFKSSSILFLLWSILYGFLFFILQLEELALLAGNIGLFIILALIMFTSKKIKLRGPKKDDEPQVITKYVVTEDKGDDL